MDFIMAIAMLCQIHGGNATPFVIARAQLRCQKEMAVCFVNNKSSDKSKTMLLCILERGSKK